MQFDIKESENLQVVDEKKNDTVLEVLKSSNSNVTYMVDWKYPKSNT